MKKIILSMVAVLALSTANAQDKKSGSEGFAKGDVFVSGALTFGSSKTGDLKVNSLEVAPSAGYFVSENIAVGVSLGLNSLKADNGSSDVTNSGTTFGAFGRYYFTPASKFSLFAQLGVDFTSSKDEFNAETGTVYAADVETKQFGLGLGLGLNYFVSSNFSLEAGVGALSYTSNDNGGNGADKTNTLSFGGDWRAVTFGVNYKF